MKICSLHISSTNLIWLLTCYFASVLDISFWHYIWQNIVFDGFMLYVFAFSLIFFIFIPLFLLFNLITLPYIFKPLTTLLLLCSAATNYYMLKFNVFVDSNMMRNVAETNMRETLELLNTTFWLYFTFSGILPAVLLCFIKVDYQPLKTEFKLRFRSFICLFVCAIILIGICFKQYAIIGRNNKEVTKLINTFNYTFSFLRYYKKKIIATHKLTILDNNPSLPANSSPKLIVLLIGETTRAQNFALNGYEQDTTPLLQKKDIIYFPDTVSCGTITSVSLPCMFAAVSRKRFNTDEARYTQNMLDILQTAGYDIEWFDNDNGCKDVCNRVPTDEVFQNCEGGICYDEVLLDKLRQKIQNIRNNTVIVLHLIGSHGPAYYLRYPPEFAKFQPDCRTTDLQTCSTDKIVNAYNNTVLYSDYIISSAIDIIQQNHQPNRQDALLFISDHGESLGENNTYLHGLPYVFAPSTQTRVPFLMWFSDDAAKNIDTVCLKNNARQNQYSQDNFFHTVIGISGVKTSVYEKNLDITANCRR
jgi:lipid A ethanolaminephosphotransferase